jgi:hypothetical protein
VNAGSARDDSIGRNRVARDSTSCSISLVAPENLRRVDQDQVKPSTNRTQNWLVGACVFNAFTSNAAHASLVSRNRHRSARRLGPVKRPFSDFVADCLLPRKRNTSLPICF